MGQKDSFATLYFEHTDPGIAALLGGAVWYVAHKYESAAAGALCGDRSTLYGPLAGLFGALLGFALATFSVVATLLQSDRLEYARRSGLDKRSARAFSLCAGWCALATFFSVVGLIADRAQGGPAKPWLVGLLVFSAVAAGLSVFRCLRIVVILAEGASSRQGAPPKETDDE